MLRLSAIGCPLQILSMQPKDKMRHSQRFFVYEITKIPTRGNKNEQIKANTPAFSFFSSAITLTF